ncbi:hypothetical protein FB45DRAFT_920694 [Roridomyces roridus]|uniref:Uncharacterized protein n=1 Tax=Roridomyces roridus TaxID=1738132 RepID=A0AAD7FJC3_9AGAR|nr:hypothetical protein FB45DRAFT_920694 [Roridomyces roridus]
MAPHFPDEIISEILAPILRVPDEHFSHTAMDSNPFATGRKSTSYLLRVCKAWLRVCTPLLYNVVILRSTAQAKSLFAALQENPEFGAFIKKLRVEGGFGASMHYILKCAPNVTDIFLSLHLSDSVSGLVLGLPVIKPNRLFIGDAVHTGQLNNKHVKELIGCLEGLASKWQENLTTVVFPYLHAERQAFVTNIIFARVKTVSFPLDIDSSDPIPQRILEIADRSAIQTVEIRTPLSAEDAEQLVSRPPASKYRSKLRIVHVASTPRVRSRGLIPGIAFASRPESIAALPIDPNFIPLAASPQATVDLVWERVLFFAMSSAVAVATGRKLSPIHRLSLFYNELRQRPNNERLQYLLVSKTFHKVGLAHLYRWPVLTQANAVTFSRTLAQEPSLGLNVRQITTASDDPATLVSPLFTHTPHLTRLGVDDAIQIDWAVFHSLAGSFGASLVELSVKVVLAAGASDTPDTAVFCRFTALRKLQWAGPDISILPNKNASGAFPSLESLVLQDQYDTGFLRALTRMELPKIRHVIFPTYPSAKQVDEHNIFLKTHGSKILEFEIFTPDLNKTLAICPNLLTLQVNLGLPKADALKAHTETFASSLKHKFLEKLVFNKAKQCNQKNEKADWELIFDAIEGLDSENFPALREVRCVQCVWPENNQKDIKESAWVKRSERMLKRGFNLTDRNGIQWCPRLTMSKSKSKSNRK